MKKLLNNSETHRFSSSILMILLILLIPLFLLTGCGGSRGDSILLATTTSTENSGLLDELLPYFTEETGIRVRVVSVGTGAAMDMGRSKDADVILVHSYEEEIRFVEEGYGKERFPVMYNDFVLLGPSDDPAGIRDTASGDILEALKILWEQDVTFVSRGDNSGTHIMELQLLEMGDLTDARDSYVSAGQGMGAVLEMADEMEGYTLSDRGTYLSMRQTLDLVIVNQGDERLFNPYGVIPVTGDGSGNINEDGALRLANWLISDKAQGIIAEFGIEEHGEPLFIPHHSGSQ